jgi:linoleoyl-CoA desaturase
LTQLIMPSKAEISRARRRAQGKAIVIAGLASAAYWGLVIATTVLLLRLICAAMLIVAVVATATSIMHDANHAALTRSARLNRLFGYSADLLGASSWLWRFKHNHLHHGNPNVVGVDSDISQAPFARLAPGQPWRPWHRYQHVYIWFLYGFLTIKWLTFADFSNLIHRRVGEQPLPRRPRLRDLALILGGKLAHITWALVIPLFFYPWWAVMGFYLICSWVVGFTLAVIFQLAHCVDTAEFAVPDEPRRGDDFELYQLRTTVDVECRVRLLRWAMGGLDHQVEHHLAPRLPHTIYPLVARRLRELCTERGVRYRVHPNLWSALRAHVRWLKLMSQRPTAMADRGQQAVAVASSPVPPAPSCPTESCGASVTCSAGWMSSSTTPSSPVAATDEARRRGAERQDVAHTVDS